MGIRVKKFKINPATCKSLKGVVYVEQRRDIDTAGSEARH